MKAPDLAAVDDAGVHPWTGPAEPLKAAAAHAHLKFASADLAHAKDRAGLFAVLDRAHPGGHAPAANPKYRCDDCPAGEPLGFVVIPPTPLGRIRGDGTGITDLWVNDGRGFVVQMFEGAPAGTTLLPGALYYTLDEDFTPVRLEVALSYEQMWDALHRAGRIDRAYSPAEERHMGTTLRWQDGTFVADTIPAASPR